MSMSCMFVYVVHMMYLCMYHPYSWAVYTVCIWWIACISIGMIPCDPDDLDDSSD